MVSKQTAIEATDTCTKARVVTCDSTTDKFELLAGVLHEDTLAPFLCIINHDSGLRKATDSMKKLTSL